MATFRPITLITGASSGIGTALVRMFAENGHEVVMVARSEPPMTALANEIGMRGQLRPLVLPMDLTRVDASARLGHELASRGLEPAYVVNNAGFGLLGTSEELDRAEQLSMIDLNIRALTELSLRWIESLRLHKGGLLNVASVAGFLPGPNMAVYYASKAYVLSFTEALHAELAPQGVKVTVLCPGPVPTAFQARAGLTGMPNILARSPEQVAHEGYRGLMAGKRVVVPGIPNKLMTFLPRLLPRSLLLEAINRHTGGQRKAAGADASWPRSPH
jgi:short-subunit dehydrogenase